MEIDIKLLDKCSELTDYEKDLVKRVDVNHESQSSVANHYGKKPSTICIQHKKALEKFTKWADEKEKREKVPSEGDFDKQAFRMFRRGMLPDKVIEKLGNTEKVVNLWQKYCELKEDDYYRAQNKMAECGYEPSGNSDYPLCEQLDELIAYSDMLYEEDEAVRAVLEEQGLKAGTAFGGYGPTSDGVKELANKLFQTQSVLVSVNNQKKELSKQLEATRNIIETLRKQIDNAQRKITEIQRLEKYENLSEEKRESLRLEIESAQALATSLRNKVEELQALKKNLEKEVDYLRLNKDGMIDTLRQTEEAVEKDIENSILEVLGNLQLNDVLRLYTDALRRKVYKSAIAQ